MNYNVYSFTVLLQKYISKITWKDGHSKLTQIKPDQFDIKFNGTVIKFHTLLDKTNGWVDYPMDVHSR